MDYACLKKSGSKNSFVLILYNYIAVKKIALLFFLSNISGAEKSQSIISIDSMTLVHSMEKVKIGKFFVFIFT